MITEAKFYKGRDKQFASELTDEIRQHSKNTIALANALLEEAGILDCEVSSGWRPAAVNAATKGAAKKSNHMLGFAVDIVDIDGKLDKWCMANLPVLERLGLWLEHPNSTPSWCHLQIVPPRSGRRVFQP